MSSFPIAAHCAPWPVNTKVTCGIVLVFTIGETSNGTIPLVTENIRFESGSLRTPRVYARSCILDGFFLVYTSISLTYLVRDSELLAEKTRRLGRKHEGPLVF